MSSVLKAPRLSLESLEAREVPANLGWTDATSNGLFDVAANWRNLDTNSTASAAPVQGDDLTFDSALTNDDLYNLHGFGLTETTADFASISLVNGYSGTVTLVADATPGLSATAFTLASGAIAQPSVTNTAVSFVNGEWVITTTTSPPVDLSVLGTFTWTGGTLNSSADLANVNLFGDGSIAPISAGTVFLGSTLTFVGTEAQPKTTTQEPGTVAVTNAAASIVVGAFANLKARTYTEGDIIGITKNQLGAGRVSIQANGLLRCSGPGTYNNNMLIVNQGQYELTGMVRANLTGGNATITDYQNNSSTSHTRIENGSVLTVPHGMLIEDGVLFLMMKSDANLPASQQTATINGTLNMSGGTILFSTPLTIGTDLTYGTLTVNGDVKWTGGTYTPSVDYTTAGLANKWVVNGTMTSAATCVVQPNPQRGNNPPASSNWAILDATTTAGNLSSVIMGSPLALAEFPVAGRKIWKLTSPEA